MYFHLTQAKIRHKMKNVHRKVSVLNHRVGKTLQQNPKYAQAFLIPHFLISKLQQALKNVTKMAALEKAPGTSRGATCTQGYQPGGIKRKVLLSFR